MVSRGKVVYSLWQCRYGLLRRTGGNYYNQQCCELNPFSICQLDSAGAASGRLAVCGYAAPQSTPYVHLHSSACHMTITCSTALRTSKRLLHCGTMMAYCMLYGCRIGHVPHESRQRHQATCRHDSTIYGYWWCMTVHSPNVLEVARQLGRIHAAKSSSL